MVGLRMSSSPRDFVDVLISFCPRVFVLWQTHVRHASSTT
jgi:hypothetical protein